MDHRTRAEAEAKLGQLVRGLDDTAADLAADPHSDGRHCRRVAEIREELNRIRLEMAGRVAAYDWREPCCSFGPHSLH